MDRRTFLASSLGVSGAAAQSASPARKPNILFILADQWRADVLPSAGDPDLIPPHLKRLAAEGIDFSRAYAAYPLCCPSRSAIATGRFPQAYGMVNNAPMLPLSERTMAQELKKAGYATRYIGKWHLDGNPGPDFIPLGERRWGFDYWAAFSRGHDYYTSVYYRDEEKPIHMDGYEPDYQTDLAVDFIRQHNNTPFYLFLSWGPPDEMNRPKHGPRGRPPQTQGMYHPEQMHLPPDVPKANEAAARAERVDYYSNCSALDQDLGKILKALDETGLADDTIVVFTSDHGDMLYSHGLLYKHLPFEPSARVPLLIRHPKKLPAGRKEDLLVSNVDFLPTFLAMCGVPCPPKVHGRDLSSLMSAGQGNRPQSIYCVCDLGSTTEWRMVAGQKSKLVVDVLRRPTHLYDLEKDPHEMRNLANNPAYATLQSEYQEVLNSWIARFA
jgi:arylsulfatase A-like enzyme